MITIDLKNLTNLELAALLREQTERNDNGAYAAIAAIVEEITRRQRTGQNDAG